MTAPATAAAGAAADAASSATAAVGAAVAGTESRTAWPSGLRRTARRSASEPALGAAAPTPAVATALQVHPDDPVVGYFGHTPEAVEVDQMELDSPALAAMRAGGIKLAIPLVSQGELVGLLGIGERRGGQGYSRDDRALLTQLAVQAGPALRVAQLVRQQQEDIQARERIEQEMQVARIIQQTLLPRKLPQPRGWAVSAHYQPARAVGGDFYDVIELPGGRLALLVGDVTDKGVPAALVMATTRAILRGAAQRLDSPGEILQRTNDLLCPDIPRNMFVTCFFAVLELGSGRLCYANAGHDPPYHRLRGRAAAPLRARGMPLGLMPGMTYEEKETIVSAGELVVLYSDGLVEAHDPARAMFGFPRLEKLVADHQGQDGVIPLLLDQLAMFTGAGWEQEDDVTLLVVTRSREEVDVIGATAAAPDLLATFTVPSAPGNERQAAATVADIASTQGLPRTRLDRLKTAVAEATMNAMEHGNGYQAAVPVEIDVHRSARALRVRITDRGGDQPIAERPTPDLEAKLAGLQSPRGWGLFLIRKMVDELHETRDGVRHTIELLVHLGEEEEDDDDGRRDGS